MASSTSSSSSTSPIPRSLHDVFLSFRGPDTRTSFTSHLLAALEQHGFSTLYDTKLPRGEHIGSGLVKAIEESRVSIVVFSKNYAASSWCLDELVKIMECKRDLNRNVLPIFYDVDPSHVRSQLGSYSEAFAKHEDGVKEGMRRVKIMECWTGLTQIVLSMFNYNVDPSQNRVKERRYPMERVESWRTALTEAANLNGYHLQNGDEARLINEIVKDMMDTFRRLDGGRSWLRMSKSSPTTSIGSWSSRYDGVPLEDMYCGCGIKVQLKTSRTKNNPGRRYWACPKYRDVVDFLDGWMMNYAQGPNK